MRTRGCGAWRSRSIRRARGSILVAGDKAGVARKRFYKALIAKADARFAEHLDTLKGN